jgi:hypothetical protein
MTNLNEQLDDVHVEHVDDHHNGVNGGGLTAIIGWHGVSTGDDGVIAYFASERDALFFRLALINARLNDIKQPRG